MASGLENIETIESPFRRFVTTIGVFPTAFTDAMTYYECLAYLVKYLEDTVIPAVNENAEALEELQTLYTQLKSYVDNYFANLDVQEEINNKLDAMVDDGTFEAILGEYFRGEIDRLDTKIDNTAEELEGEISTSITAEANARTNADKNLQTQITGLASGAPIPVANTSAMTDHSKVYVNTTDGKWYYWNGSAWAAGGTYQSSGIASDSVKTSSLETKLLGSLFIKSTNVNALGKVDLLYNTVENATTHLYVLSGTSITFSNDFVSNYQWAIFRCSYPDGIPSGTVKDFSTDTTYQFTNDEYCIIEWKPRDNDWSSTTYTVDRKHKLDADDITSLTYYYPKYNDIIDGISDAEYSAFDCSCRTFSSSGDILLYNSSRWGMNVAIKSASKVKVSMLDSRFDWGIMTVRLSEDNTNHRYYEVTYDSGWLSPGETIIPANTLFIFSMRTPNNGDLRPLVTEMRNAISITPYASISYIDSVVNQVTTLIPDYDKFVKGINHRGYNSVAPENTIPAFKLSAKKGFKYVESDLQFTSDSVPVMIHDDTIDRTSNGTGRVDSMTYAQISQYDFGSWKSADYTGTTIPTFYQFLECCKECGLTPYIELKTSTITDAQYEIIVNAIRQYGLMDKVTFISFNIALLQGIHSRMPKTRLGFIYNGEVTDAIIAMADTIKGDDNEVTIDIWTNSLTTEGVNKCMTAGYPLEVWTVDTDEGILALPDYVTGVTSDLKIAGKVLLDNALSD